MAQRAEEIQAVEPRMAYYCRLYAIKRVSSSALQQQQCIIMQAPSLLPATAQAHQAR
jgi:hypothetical protein